MKVEDIPANEIVVMTPELYQEFCRGGCVPMCHLTEKFISIGEPFKLSTVKHVVRFGKLEDRDVMLAENSSVDKYNNKVAQEIYQKTLDKLHKVEKAEEERIEAMRRSGGCFRVNSKIVL